MRIIACLNKEFCLESTILSTIVTITREQNKKRIEKYIKFEVDYVVDFNVAQFNKRLISLLRLSYIKAHVKALKEQQIYRNTKRSCLQFLSLKQDRNKYFKFSNQVQVNKTINFTIEDI